MQAIETTQQIKQVSLFYGASMVVSTAIGVGMMSLPIVSVGMWFILSVVVVLITSLYMLAAGSLLLEVNMKYPIGTGFHSMIKDCMGIRLANLNDIMMIFNGFILLYAYITAGTETIQGYYTLVFDTDMERYSGALLFTAVLGAIICCKPIVIGRISCALIAIMVVSFGYLALHLADSVSSNNIISQQNSLSNYTFDLLPYVLLTLPFFMAATGYQQIVPMLRSLYNNQPKQVINSILLGLILVSACYIFWMFVIMGNQSQSDMINLISNGNNSISDIIALITNNNADLESLMIFFVQVAVITSFIGVAKGLLDYLSDIMVNQFGFKSRYPKLLVLVPPLLCSLAFPNGFLIAIGFAGLAGAIWGGVFPALLVRISRKKHPNTDFVTLGGNLTPWLVLCYSILIITSMLLSSFDLLPIMPL